MTLWVLILKPQNQFYFIIDEYQNKKKSVRNGGRENLNKNLCSMYRKSFEVFFEIKLKIDIMR